VLSVRSPGDVHGQYNKYVVLITQSLHGATCVKEINRIKVCYLNFTITTFTYLICFTFRVDKSDEIYIDV